MRESTPSHPRSRSGHVLLFISVNNATYIMCNVYLFISLRDHLRNFDLARILISLAFRGRLTAVLHRASYALPCSSERISIVFSGIASA